MVAYAIFGLAAWHAGQTRTAARSVRFHASHLFGLIVLQVALGIATLLFVAPFALALLHQLGAVIVLGASTRHLALLGRY
jgi:cytochrome c oxidase assembly protein subunit 15